MERIKAAGPAGIVYPTRNELIVTGGRYRIEWDDLPKIPEINLRADQWEDITGRIADGQEVELEFESELEVSDVSEAAAEGSGLEAMPSMEADGEAMPEMPRLKTPSPRRARKAKRSPNDILFYNYEKKAKD